MEKGIYSYGHMHGWEKFIEKLLPKNEDFYSNLSIGIDNGEEFEKTLKWKQRWLPWFVRSK